MREDNDEVDGDDTLTEDKPQPTPQRK